MTLKKLGGKITVNAVCKLLLFGLYKEVFDFKQCFVDLTVHSCMYSKEYKNGKKIV